MATGSCEDRLGAQLVPCQGRRLDLCSLKEILDNLFQFFLKSLPLVVLLKDIRILGLMGHLLDDLLDILLEWMLGAVLTRAEGEGPG